MLKSLDLTNNDIGAEGAKALATALSEGRAVLKTLNLAGNRIDTEGAKALAAALSDGRAVLTKLKCVRGPRTRHTERTRLTRTPAQSPRRRASAGTIRSPWDARVRPPEAGFERTCSPFRALFQTRFKKCSPSCPLSHQMPSPFPDALSDTHSPSFNTLARLPSTQPARLFQTSPFPTPFQTPVLAFFVCGPLL